MPPSDPSTAGAAREPDPSLALPRGTPAVALSAAPVTPVTPSAPPGAALAPTAPAPDASAVLALVQRQRDAVEDEDRKAQDRLDQIVLVGGTGAVLASVSFLKDVAPAPVPGTLEILVAAWVAFLGGGFCAVLSLLTTRRTARALLQVYAAMLAEGRPTMTAAEHAPVEEDNRRTRTLSAAGLTVFAAGVCLLLTFAGFNLPWHLAGPARSPAAPPAALPASQSPAQPPSRPAADAPAAVPSRPEPPAGRGRPVQEGVRFHDPAAGPAAPVAAAADPRPAPAGTSNEEVGPRAAPGTP